MTENNVNLSQEITHVGTDHITLTFGGDATHNSSSVTKSFNVAKADLGTIHVEGFPSMALKDSDVTFRVCFTDVAGYNPFRIDEFTLALYKEGQLYYENNAMKIYSSDRNTGYADITFNVGHAEIPIEIALSVSDSTHYNKIKIIEIGTVNVVSSLAVEYGLGTENPWTSTLTNAIIDNGRAWTNYTKTPALYSGIPVSGDFEITLVIGRDAPGGTGNFGLSNITGTEVLMANLNNTVNNVRVNTIFPTVNVDETITMKREGTTYTYQHGSETKTFTINNTETLYLKVNKSGNGSLYVKTMSVIGGGAMNKVELDCTTGITDWIICNTTPAIKTLDGSTCLMIQCNVYDWTLADYEFDITKSYTLHTELNLNNKSWGYIRVGFIDNGLTKDVNNAHIVEYANENGFKWRKLTRANGNDTVVSTALTNKQIKYNGWVDVDFRIIEGEIYASYTTSSNETITEEFVGKMDYNFWFGMSSWISTTNGMGCRKFVVTEY